MPTFTPDWEPYWHQVSAEELRSYNATMAEKSRPGQLAFIAIEAARSSVENHNEASMPRIKS